MNIEEDMKIIDNFITYFNKNIQDGYRADLTILGEEIETLEHLLSDYKRVLKENERYQKSDYEAICLENNELSETIDRIQSEYNDLLKENEELKKSKITYKDVRDIQEKNKNIVDKNYISKQKVKDKIEKLEAQYKIALEENSTKAFILKCQITILQELLGESEE